MRWMLGCIKKNPNTYTCERTKAGSALFLRGPIFPFKKYSFFVSFLSGSFLQSELGTCCWHFISAFLELNDWDTQTQIVHFCPQISLRFLGFLNIHGPAPNKASADQWLPQPGAPRRCELVSNTRTLGCVLPEGLQL